MRTTPTLRTDLSLAHTEYVNDAAYVFLVSEVSSSDLCFKRFRKLLRGLLFGSRRADVFTEEGLALRTAPGIRQQPLECLNSRTALKLAKHSQQLCAGHILLATHADTLAHDLQDPAQASSMQPMQQAYCVRPVPSHASQMQCQADINTLHVKQVPTSITIYVA